MTTEESSRTLSQFRPVLGELCSHAPRRLAQIGAYFPDFWWWSLAASLVTQTGWQLAGVCCSSVRAVRSTFFSQRRQRTTYWVSESKSSGTTQHLLCRSVLSGRCSMHLALSYSPLGHISGLLTQEELSFPVQRQHFGYPKADRDYLGGWSAQGCDRYARVSVLRITNMQRAVVSLGKPECEDEAETVQQYEIFLKSQGVSNTDRTKHVNLLVSKEAAQLMHAPEMLAAPDGAAVKRKSSEKTRRECVGSRRNPWLEPEGGQSDVERHVRARFLHLFVRQEAYTHAPQAGCVLPDSRSGFSGVCVFTVVLSTCCFMCTMIEQSCVLDVVHRTTFHRHVAHQAGPLCALKRNPMIVIVI